MDSAVLDDIINRLLDARNYPPGRHVQLAESEICQLCAASKDIFLTQPCLLELKALIKIAGDIHGQYSDLLRLLYYGGFPPEVNYLFLGNYVDFGKQSLETICLLLAFKIKYPENLFLLRGNHECASISRIYGFFYECMRRLSDRLWVTFLDCFNCLPIAALIDDKIFCIHGGLSPDLLNLDQIRNIPRPIDVPASGLLWDLLSSDPSTDVQGWGMNDLDLYGVSYTFGADKVTEFLMKQDLDLICRGHQVVGDGYEFFADRQLVTIFSAPNYNGKYENAGAIMNVDETLECSFQFLERTKGASIAQSGSSSEVDLLHNTATKRFEDVAPMVKSFGWMVISKFGRSNSSSKPEGSQGVNPSKSSTSTAKYKSNSPEIKPTERNTAKSSDIGSNSPTITIKSKNSLGLDPSTSKPASKYRSVSFGFMPAERMSNTNTGRSNNVTANLLESSQQASRPFKNDPADLNKSKSPGIKSAERMRNSNIGRSNNVTANLLVSSQQATGPFKIDPADRNQSKSPWVKERNFFSSKPTSKYKSASPGFTHAERMRNSNIGRSTSVTDNLPLSSKQATGPFKIDPSDLNKSKSPGVKPAETMSNSNTGRVTTNLPESSEQATRPFKIDPADRYRSTSPGVKRFLGARV